MAELMNELNERYETYIASQVSKAKAKTAPSFSRFHYLNEACGIAQKLHKDYDLGIALATDGLWLGYIAKQFDFPTLNVKMGRRFNGAIWNPIDEVCRETIEGKKIVVFDNDIVTGRTIKRAAREIKKLNPEYADLLLVYGHTEVSPYNYHKWKRFMSDNCRVLGNDVFGNYHLDSLCQIPRGEKVFRNVRSLEKDFEEDLEARKTFEEIVSNGI